MSHPDQPDENEVLANGLTCREIYRAIMAASSEGFWGYTSLIDEEELVEQLVAVNDRTGFSASFSVGETLADAPDHNNVVDVIVEYACELHIGNVYIWGNWIAKGASDGDQHRARKMAEEAFIKAAAMIGKKVERRLFVVADDEESDD